MSKTDMLLIMLQVHSVQETTCIFDLICASQCIISFCL